MKRFICIILTCFVIATTVFASGMNYQKIYAVDDPVYQKITSLYLLAGRSLPSTTGPWSGAELKAMVEKIDVSSLSDQGKALYNNVLEVLDKDASSPVFKANLEVDLEAYINSNYESKFFQSRENWFLGWANQKPAINIITEEHISTAFYGFFDFSIGVAKNWSDGGARTREFGDSILWTNIPFLLANNMKQLDFNFPIRAFVAAGGEHWSFVIGRDRLSWGNGKTGNFVIGDHIKYHNAASFKAYDGNFKYTFLISAFPHPQMYYKTTTTGMELSLYGLGRGQSAYMNGIAAFIAHRLEWNILKNLSFTLTEGVMYMSKDNKIDLIAFAPAMLYHNNYTRSNTNSILAFEADWTIIKGLNVYGQVVIDESVLPGENSPSNTEGKLAEPNGLGLLLGTTYKKEAFGGIITLNAEGAVTSPYLYLRDGDAQAGEDGRQQTNGRYGINFVVALREMSGAGGNENYNLDFLGYKYGGDAIVALLGAQYEVVDKWDAGLNLFLMLHGTHDKYTAWTRVNDTIGGTKMTNKTTPTTDHQTANYNDENASQRDSVSTSFVTSLFGSYAITKSFKAEAEVDLIYIKNPGNIKANGSIFGTQTTVRLSYTL